MTDANIVLKVNEFKKLCSALSKASNHIKLEYQEHAMKITAGSHKVSYGRWDDTAPSHTDTI